MPSILYSVDVNSWYLLVSMLLGLCVAAFAGKMTWGQTVRRDAAFDDELKVVLGGTLSMFGLLMGFILSFAISGLNTRMTAEENEAIAIGNAFQRTTLLSESQQEQAEKMLMDYLAIRISFFATEDDDQRAAIRLDSIKMQSHMWALISNIAKEKPSSVIVTALNATNELYVSQQKTMASWRPQIPGVAWALLILGGCRS